MRKACVTWICGTRFSQHRPHPGSKVREWEVLRLTGRLLSRKHDVYDRSSRTTISQATTLKRESERETRAVHLQSRYRENMRCIVHIRHYRSQYGYLILGNRTSFAASEEITPGNEQLLFTVPQIIVHAPCPENIVKSCIPLHDFATGSRVSDSKKTACRRFGRNVDDPNNPNIRRNKFRTYVMWKTCARGSTDISAETIRWYDRFTLNWWSRRWHALA